MEQLLQLARTAENDGLLQLISQALEVPGVFVFSDFLDLPNIIQVNLCSKYHFQIHMLVLRYQNFLYELLNRYPYHLSTL